MVRKLTLLGLALLAAARPDASLGAEAPRAEAVDREQAQARLPRLLEELDHADFKVRHRAAATLEQWVDTAELSTLLAGEFERRLLDPATSFEVRWQLERWQRRLPPLAERWPSGETSLEELGRLIAQLDDDSYGVRVGALRRLLWIVRQPTMICPAVLRLKERLADPGLSADARRRLEPVWQEIRGVWLLSDPAQWKLPPVNDAQIRAWIDDLAAGSSSLQQAARSELMDVLARDEYVPRVQSMLESRLAGPLDSKATVRLEEIRELLRPALVAEYWKEHRHRGEQHLVIGIPSMSQDAQRASHFDRADEHSAHCLSGNNLSPGDYPVGVAVPHPVDEAAFFHLVYLPTPRAQMGYEYYVRTDEAQRLAEISRRTFQRLLAEKRPLTDRELTLLEQLDAKELSRFAGPYFNQVDDEPLLSGDVNQNSGSSSRHGAICALLVSKGTKEAVPGLLQAIQARRFLEPTGTPPCRLPWLAALAIAGRDPWTAVDAWLAEQIDRTELLVEGQELGPDVGGTAAGLLLTRRHQQPARFGLHGAGMIAGQVSGIDTYRFKSSEDRQRVRQWWLAERNQPSPVEPRRKVPAQSR